VGERQKRISLKLLKLTRAQISYFIQDVDTKSKNIHTPVLPISKTVEIHAAFSNIQRCSHLNSWLI